MCLSKVAIFDFMTYLGSYDFVVIGLVSDADTFAAAFEMDAPQSMLSWVSVLDEFTIEFYVACTDQAQAGELFEECCDAIGFSATIDRIESAAEYSGL